MRLRTVNDHEKRLTLGQVVPVGFIGVPGVAIGPSADVVVGFGHITDVVSRLFEQVGIVFDCSVRNRIAAAHLVSSSRQCIDASDPATSRGSTNRCIGVTVQVAKPFRRKLVNVRSLGVWIPIAADPIDTVVFRSQPENIWTIIGVCEFHTDDEQECQV